MKKNRTLEFLSGIQNASSSVAVERLFEDIKKRTIQPKDQNTSTHHTHTMLIEELRSDKIVACSEEEKELIRSNFPQNKGRYLVVSKEVDN